MPIFDENNFIKLVIDAYINEGYDTILCLFLEDFLEIYTDNNTIDENINIINIYNYSINDAIDLFEFYYDIKFDFNGTKINYAELASIILYHYFYNKLLNIIIDNYDSSKDTDEE
jgi:hypothetical protein